VVIHDISKRHKAEEALLEAKNLAEDASRMKNEFLANMSHEVRTPLNGMLGMLQIMRDTPLDSEQLELLEAAQQSGQGLSTLLNDLLDFSMIESGRLPLRTTDFNLHTILSNITMVFRRQCMDKQVELLLEMEGDVPEHMHGDKGRLRQILFNLVGNAVKFTENGTITVLTSRLASDRDDEIRLMFSVTDTGIGIDEEKLNEIFKPFTQVDGSVTRRYEGVGLGLSIVNRLARFMNGRISVESWPGEGTSIHVVLPLLKAQTERAKRKKQDAHPRRQRQGRVLIAEDNPVNRIAAKRFVEKLGFEAHCALNGKEAVERLRTEPFDCILMDVQMPVISGVEATRQIRSDTSGDFDPNIPIIAMTAHVMTGDRECFIEQGMNAYLAKPVDYEELAEVLDAWIR